MNEQPTHRRVFVWTHPRSASHLFYQLLKEHPIFQNIGSMSGFYAYTLGTDMQSSFSREQWQRFLGTDNETAAKISYQGCVDDLQKKVAEAESEGKWPLAMEHPCTLMPSSLVNSHLSVPGRETKPTTVVVDRMLDVGDQTESPLPADLGMYHNPTLLPDRFFFSFTPIITIRHPARTIPSWLRSFHSLGGTLLDTEFPVFADSFRWERLVFDSFMTFEKSRAAEEGREVNTPIVVDGEKLVKDPHGQMKKVCGRLGIDEEGIKYSWERPQYGKGLEAGETIMGAINRSTGVVADARYNKPLDVKDEVEKWAEEWDENVASILEGKVAAAMEDYEYLLQFSL
ncbi:hypothetical protein V5O48_013975 [Marasmius crinis-equi]|uniref:Sulfotransferase family protein n=1 Tax=Marasmius crinis-equi TaxID=585013 RepID=A0ABR3EYL3_9AGAR